MKVSDKVCQNLKIQRKESYVVSEEHKDYYDWGERKLTIITNQVDCLYASV